MLQRVSSPCSFSTQNPRFIALLPLGIKVVAVDPVAEPYHSLYLPPASKCIRVLDVDGASTETAAVVGHLRIVDLATSPNFTAISYVWGLPEPHQFITCNGVDITISINGYSALQHLRKRLGAFTIWVDAICIDQKNTKEKEHQIPLMGDIYSQAATVYAWLGEGNRKTDRAIEYMETAGFLNYFHTESANSQATNFGYWRPFLAACSASTARFSLVRHPFLFIGTISSWRHQRGPLGRTLLRLCNKKTKYANEDDMTDLLKRNWIRRLWTLQEVLLAANPVVVCGNAHIRWDRFAISLVFLDTASPGLASCIQPWKRVALSRQHMPPDILPSGPLENSLGVYNQFARRMCRIHLFVTMAAVLSLVVGLHRVPYHLQMAFTLSAPQHRALTILVGTSMCIFIILAIQELRLNGLLVGIGSRIRRQVILDDLIDGVYTREAREHKDMAFGLWAVLQRRTRLALPHVDYEESKENIYVAFSRLLVQITGSPHLVLIAALNNMKGQPSWAPDWTPSEGRECHWGDIEQLLGYDCVAYGNNHESTGNGRISMMSDHAMSIHGRRQGVVVATYHFHFHKTQSSYQEDEYQKHIYNLEQMLQIIDILDLGLTFDGDIGVGSEYRRWKRFLCRHRRKNAPALFALLRDASYWRGPNSTATEDRKLLRTHLAICNTLAGYKRSLFQGSRWGTLPRAPVGWCRRNVKNGDLIIRCPGVEIPLIVRPCSDGTNGVQIKSIAFTPWYMNRTTFLERCLGAATRTLQPHGSVESELEEFHVY